MIAYLYEKYKKNEEWIITKREKIVYYDANNTELDSTDVILGNVESSRKEHILCDVDEGDTSDYWEQTAANAIKPLYQLIALAKIRPDCIWDGV